MWAEITRPLADGITDTVNLTLKDDGVVTDIIKDDGIYSGNFFQFSDKGRYSIKGKIPNQKPKPKMQFSFGIWEQWKSIDFKRPHGWSWKNGRCRV